MILRQYNRIAIYLETNLKIKQRECCEHISYLAYWNQAFHDQTFKNSSSLEQRWTKKYKPMIKATLIVGRTCAVNAPTPN